MFSALKYVTFILPSLWKSDRASISCFLETPDSTRYTHGTLSLSGLFHLTYPTPALEAFPSWFSNSWNLLTVIGQVSLAHMATQPGMSQSCLDCIRGVRSPQAPSQTPARGRAALPALDGTTRPWSRSPRIQREPEMDSDGPWLLLPYISEK